VHDSVQGENFHIRCRSSNLQYNWFARATNYEGDLMSDDDFSGTGPFMQTMTLLGNVFVQNALPGNHSQVVALYNDAGLANLTLSLHMLYNTFVGVNTNSALVHVSNADGTQMSAEISDNIIYGTKTAVLIENTNKSMVSGLNNWLQTNAASGPLVGSIRSGTPGFRNLAAKDFTLVNGSPCTGAATPSVSAIPGQEYSQAEATNRLWRIRNSALDLGAFEGTTTTNSSYGPYDPFPSPVLEIINEDGNAVLSWPLYAQDFQLYSSGSLVPSTWIRSSSSYTTNLTGVSSVGARSSSAQFLRLKR
jgi:hypothetical protein